MESYSQVVLFFVRKNEPGGLHACMKAHSANAYQQVIWLRGISNAGGSRWVERRVEFMILEFVSVWAGCKSISCVCQGSS